MAHQTSGAPLVYTNGAPPSDAPLVLKLLMAHPAYGAPLVPNFFFELVRLSKHTNGAPPEGAPLVTWITNGAFRVGAPLVSGQQQDILDSLSYPHSLSPHFILSTSSLSRVPPLFHLISTIDSFNLSG